MLGLGDVKITVPRKSWTPGEKIGCHFTPPFFRQISLKGAWIRFPGSRLWIQQRARQTGPHSGRGMRAGRRKRGQRGAGRDEGREHVWGEREPSGSTQGGYLRAALCLAIHIPAASAEHLLGREAQPLWACSEKPDISSTTRLCPLSGGDPPAITTLGVQGQQGPWGSRDRQGPSLGGCSPRGHAHGVKIRPALRVYVCPFSHVCHGLAIY